MSCGIYKITNPKGSIYIGQSVDIDRRWAGYRRNLGKGQPKLYNSLKKYGFESHLFEIIEECSDELLLERETFWKLHYDVLNSDSLCCMIDGRGGRMSKETCEKISKANKGKPKIKLRGRKLTESQLAAVRRPRTPEIIKNISNGLKGRVFSEVHRKNISLATKGRPAHNKGVSPSEETIKLNKENQPNRREVLQFDMDGNLIKEWKSISDANRAFKGKGFPGGCLSGKQKTAGGFIWKYKDGLPPNERKGGPAKGRTSKNKGKLYTSGTRPVLQFDLNGNFLRRFISCSEAEYHFPCKGINSCCHKNQQTAGGYRWKFEDDMLDLEPLVYKIVTLPILQISLEGDLIAEFENVSAARSVIGVVSGIYSCCKGLRSSFKGFIWKYKQTEVNEAS